MHNTKISVTINKYNQSFPISYPPNVTRLTINTDQQLPSDLPKTIIHIYIHRYAYKLPPTLPRSVRCLYFGDTYDYPIEIPSNVVHVQYPYYYKHPYNIPDNVKSLSLYVRTNPIINVSNGTITNLLIGDSASIPHLIYNGSLMYYLLVFFEPYGTIYRKHSDYSNNLQKRIKINIHNRLCRRQGLFDNVD